jgi:hypothetical protein
MNIKSLLAGVALVALASPAFAVTQLTANAGILDANNTSGAAFVQNTKNTTFEDFFTVETQKAGTLLIASLTFTISKREPINQYAPGVFSLYSGTPTGVHTLIDTVVPVFTASSIPHNGGHWDAVVQASGTNATPIPVGFYYAELTGSNQNGVGSFSPTVSYNFTPVTGGIPEMSTWGMMLAGFSALGFAGYRRRTVAA